MEMTKKAQSAPLEEFINKMMHRRSNSATREFYSKYIDVATSVFAREPIVLDIDTRHLNTVIVGDLHGDLYTFRRIVQFYPPASHGYVLMGDYIDRGDNSVELLAFLLANKIVNPQNFIILRGDHESRDGQDNDFDEELWDKVRIEDMTQKVYFELFTEMPVAAVINKKYFAVHGGIPIDAPMISKLATRAKVAVPSSDPEILQLLWNDPQKGKGSSWSSRGSGIYNFGPDIANRFLKKNGLSMILRGHERKNGGYELDANKKILTLHSTTIYGTRYRPHIGLLSDKGLEIIRIGKTPESMLRID